MATLAFVGLGLMGTPMATRLLEAGHDLTVWNRTAERTRPLAERGASVAATPAQAAAGVEAAITMVANPEALEQVVFGTNGLAATLGPGQLLIDMSTVGPDAVSSVATRLPHGVGMVDAPVRAASRRRRPATWPSTWAPTRATCRGSSRSSPRWAPSITSADRAPGRPPRWW
jgi:3-hydroxyisobutyrate dehydrogenase-like beta-hydroxyacid dehydrogenase